MAPKMRPTPKFGMMQDGAARAAQSHPNYAIAAALAAAESSPTRVASREGAVFPVAEAIAFWEQKRVGVGFVPCVSDSFQMFRFGSGTSDFRAIGFVTEVSDSLQNVPFWFRNLSPAFRMFRFGSKKLVGSTQCGEGVGLPLYFSDSSWNLVNSFWNVPFSL